MDRDSKQERIRARAYRIWEEEGRPEGREREHWDKASELEAQEHPPAGATEPNPVARGETRARRDRPVEPPEALENQGEFPGLADQGEESPAVPHPSGERPDGSVAKATPGKAAAGKAGSPRAASRRAAPPKAAEATDPATPAKRAPQRRAAPKKS